MDKLLVCVLTFDRPDVTKTYLPDLLDDVFRVREIDVDPFVVLYDNSSSNETYDWLSGVYRENRDIFIFKSEVNKGKAAVTEVCYMFESDYFLELDDDIEIPRYTITSLIEAIRMSPDHTCFIGMNMNWGSKPGGFVDNWKNADDCYEYYCPIVGDLVRLFNSDCYLSYNKNLFINGACRVSRTKYFSQLEHRDVYGTDVDINRQSFEKGFMNGFLLSVNGKRMKHHGPSRFYEKKLDYWQEDADR